MLLRPGMVAVRLFCEASPQAGSGVWPLWVLPNAFPFPVPFLRPRDGRCPPVL